MQANTSGYWSIINHLPKDGLIDKGRALELFIKAFLYLKFDLFTAKDAKLGDALPFLTGTCVADCKLNDVALDVKKLWSRVTKLNQDEKYEDILNIPGHVMIEPTSKSLCCSIMVIALTKLSAISMVR